MASELIALLFAASVSDSKRRSESVEDGASKIARLAELAPRSPFPTQELTIVAGLVRFLLMGKAFTLLVLVHG